MVLLIWSRLVGIVLFQLETGKYGLWRILSLIRARRKKVALSRVRSLDGSFVDVINVMEREIMQRHAVVLWVFVS